MSRSSRHRRRRHYAVAAVPAGRRNDVHSDSRYIAACATAESGDLLAAQKAFEQLLPELRSNGDRAIVQNGLGTVAASAGDTATARQWFEKALGLDSQLSSARENL